jgi:hypothetical protein
VADTIHDGGVDDLARAPALTLEERRDSPQRKEQGPAAEVTAEIEGRNGRAVPQADCGERAVRAMWLMSCPALRANGPS